VMEAQEAQRLVAEEECAELPEVEVTEPGDSTTGRLRTNTPPHSEALEDPVNSAFEAEYGMQGGQLLEGQVRDHGDIESSEGAANVTAVSPQVTKVSFGDAEVQAPIEAEKQGLRVEVPKFLEQWSRIAGEGRGSSSMEWIHEWLQPVPGQRDQFFFQFITVLAKQCGNLFARGDDIPGFESIMAGMASRLKATPLVNYSAALLNCCNNLLQQYPELLDRFLCAALSQVNLYDNVAVSEACKVMGGWFAAAAERYDGVLPETAELTFFPEAVNVLLESQQFQVILKALVFLYDHINMLPTEARSRLISSILDKFFFKLFLHWLEEVRFFFCHLLVFKLFRTSRWEVFRFMQDMEYLRGLQIDVPKHLQTPAKYLEDDGGEAHFCICSKFAYYLGIVLEQVEHPRVAKVDREFRPYSTAALQQLLRVLRMSYECNVDEAPVLNFNPKKLS